MLVQTSNSPYCFRQKMLGAPKLYLSSGIHGDETSGPYTLMNLATSDAGMFNGIDTTIFPLLNPWGREHNTRHNANDVDLNRDFADQKEQETRDHLKLVGPYYDLAICFHEASEADGVYIYKPRANKNIPAMTAMLKAMKEVIPLDSRHGNLEIYPGVMKDDEYKELHETEAIYLANRGLDAFTVEVPHDLPMDVRQRTLLSGIAEAVRIVTAK